MADLCFPRDEGDDMTPDGGNGLSANLDVILTIATASTLANHSEGWTLDALCNWSSSVTDGIPPAARTHA